MPSDDDIAGGVQYDGHGVLIGGAANIGAEYQLRSGGIELDQEPIPRGERGEATEIGYKRLTAFLRNHQLIVPKGASPDAS